MANGRWPASGAHCHAPRKPEFPESDYAAYLKRLCHTCAKDASRLVLVAHQPPYDTSADLLPNGIHVGSHALRTFIDCCQPACCLAGHIHEAASRGRSGSTLIVNPGPFAKGMFSLVEL
jgi:Icc-related predicted phosphoesterase